MSEKLEQNKLFFLPLGGSGEIGMNLNLYSYNDDWLMVDLGVSFHDQLGIDVMMPNAQYIVERKKKLSGLLLTHAHEDHIGAVPYLWDQLKCPIYATPFTAELVRRKLDEAGIDYEGMLHEIPLGGKAKIGSFEIQMVSLTHSIPEPNGVVIRTPAGNIFHTGDWKIDLEPLVGEPINADEMKKIGDEGILALVCDSTNVFNEGTSGSEGDVRRNLMEVIKSYKKERIFVSCFASNLARIETLAHIAKEVGRRVVLQGRSFGRITEVARANGYLKDIPEFISARQAMDMPANKVLYVSSGSQGEQRAALTRMANNQMRDAKIEAGDVVIFSSRVIPGNEKRINILKNTLTRAGARVIAKHTQDIHVSGHPARDELRQMYDWIRPQILVPVHGEFQHLVEHAKLGKKHGIKDVVVPENGTLIRLEKNNVDIVDEVPAGRLIKDGNALVSIDHPAVKERSRLADNGVVSVSLTLGYENEVYRKPQIAICGIVSKGDLVANVSQTVEDVLNEMSDRAKENISVVSDRITMEVKRCVREITEKKPMVLVHINRL
tara:strand:+ start:15627 stop:17276 length:1650 start_codon:yes stop_codon:yes gene_type:complete